MTKRTVSQSDQLQCAFYSESQKHTYVRTYLHTHMRIHAHIHYINYILTHTDTPFTRTRTHGHDQDKMNLTLTSKLELQKFSDIVKHSSAPHDSLYDGGKVVVQNNNVGCFLGDLERK